MSSSRNGVASSTPRGRQPRGESEPPLRPLDPAALPAHLDALYRAARARCGSRDEAEDLVQDTFARVLTRPRLLRSDQDLGYLLRALRNTLASGHRASMRRPIMVPLPDETQAHSPGEVGAGIGARELMATIASRLARGRQHIARALGEPVRPSRPAG